MRRLFRLLILLALAPGLALAAGPGPAPITVPVTAPNGGTGKTTLTAHGVLIGEGTAAVAITSAGASGQVLESGGASADPTWASISGSGTVTSVTAGTCLAGGTFTTSGTISISGGLTVACGGTGATSASGTALDNISGISCTGVIVRTGSATYACDAIGQSSGQVAAGNDSRFSGLTQAIKSAAYTTVLGDCGTQLYHPSSDTTARTLTIASNASVAAPVGCKIDLVNDCSAGVWTIAITTDTLVWFTAGSTGSRALQACGEATLTKVAATRWVVTGAGLSLAAPLDLPWTANDNTAPLWTAYG
jgi:hypothetical protein